MTTNTRDFENILPNTFIREAAGCCMVAAKIIAGKLMAANIPDITVIEGWIRFSDDDGSAPEDMRFAHTWVKAGDVIIDPTVGQFQDYLDHYTYDRIEKESLPANLYMADKRINTATPESYFKDRVIPIEVQEFLQGLVPPPSWSPMRKGLG